MFVLKQIAGYLLSPLPLGLLLILAGLILSFTYRTWLARLCTFLGLLTITLASLTVFTAEHLRANQYAHPPLTKPEAYLERTTEENRWVAVLGTGFNGDAYYPVNSQIGRAFLARVIEGKRLLDTCAGSRMILFLPGKSDNEIKDQWFEEFAQLINLDRSRVFIVYQVRDTAEEAVKTREIVGQNEVIIVTGASYMVRAMETFITAGLRPTAAPSGFSMARKKPGDRIKTHQVIPTAGGLYNSQQVIHEWLGTTWQKLTR